MQKRVNTYQISLESNLKKINRILKIGSLSMMILLKKMSISLKKERKLTQYSMDKWKNDWNFLNMTKRRQNNLDWRNTNDFQHDDVIKITILKIKMVILLMFF